MALAEAPRSTYSSAPEETFRAHGSALRLERFSHPPHQNSAAPVTAPAALVPVLCDCHGSYESLHRREACSHEFATLDLAEDLLERWNYGGAISSRVIIKVLGRLQQIAVAKLGNSSLPQH